MRLMLIFLATLLVPTAASAQRGVPQSGFPSYQERMMLVLANRARVDPSRERYNSCGVTAAKAPLTWGYNLNRVARFHSANLSRTSTFQHDSPCTLVSNISLLFAPNGTCDGSASCACVGGTAICNASCNDFGSRLALFGVSGGARSENIARGQTSPREVHDGWMNSSGHCANLLGDFVSFGGGAVGTYWTQNFSSVGSLAGTLLAGGHEPQSPGSSAANIEFRVTYHDTRGGPVSGAVNIDGWCSPMSLERGRAASGTYLATVSLGEQSCNRYFFVFEDPDGEFVYLPETGSYGVGGFGCEDWTPEMPLPCGQLIVDPPTIAIEAQADPDPVITTTTTLSVEGAHESGESSLIYTWSASGPAQVTFSQNASNAAKTTVATFSRAGDYSFEALITDRQGQSIESFVEVEVLSRVAIAISPRHANVAMGGSRRFSASAGNDQFGEPPPDQISFTWSVTGGGTIDADGLFEAGDAVGGPHTVRSVGAGAEATATVKVVDEDFDTTPPEVWLIQPVDGQVVFGVVRFVAVATDDVEVARVGFLVNGQLMASVLQEPYQLDWNGSGYPEGEIEISARATDLWGNDATSPPVRVRLVDPSRDRGPPVVALVSPREGEVIVEPVLWIVAEAEDDVGVAEVAFEINGEVLGTEFAAPWDIGVDLSLHDRGELLIVAIAKDVAGNITRSEPVRVVLERGGCGCATGGSGADAAMLLVLALGLGILFRHGRRP